MNTLSATVWRDLAEEVAGLRNNEQVIGIILTSGKSSGFCAGADLQEMEAATRHDAADPAQFSILLEEIGLGSRVARALETCGKPVVAAINGLALGGGLELALACHYRIVVDDEQIRLGLPEATLGLLPGGGGTQRLSRLLGAVTALTYLIEGRIVGPAGAFEAGMVDALVPAGTEIEAARAWIRDAGDSVARWDRPGFVPPGGLPYSAEGNVSFIAAVADVSNGSQGNYPARDNIARAVYEGIQLPFDLSLKTEFEYFVRTLRTPQATAMIRTQFYSMNAMRKAGATTGQGRALLDRIAVLGAGMMGAGIAFVAARAGLETVLLDVSLAQAERGKDYSRGIVRKMEAQGKISVSEGERLLARIRTSEDYGAVAGVDVVIETVFEDAEVKAEATRRALSHLSPDTLFATNTSTIPIGRLAQAHPRPESFLGMHFHSPVDRMALVEVVVGEHTDKQAIDRALQCVRRLGKVAIVAHDAPFFYTSRVFDTYIREGMEMLADGISPAIIDQIGRMTGMPRGPLELSDDVAIDLIDRIARQRVLLLGDAADRRRSDDVVDLLIRNERFGRKNGRGFYDYGPDRQKHFWADAGDHWPRQVASASPADISLWKKRLLHRQAVEAARCLIEGVLEDVRHADVGAILGWGFPQWTGGPISYIEQVGLTAFVQDCDRFADTLGDRFRVPDMLRQRAAENRPFYVS